MAGTGSADLFGLANDYLDACVIALADTPEGPPSRVYVSPGAPVWDCPEQLTVHVGGPLIADTLPVGPTLAPLHRIALQVQVNLIVLTATILRCAPTIDDYGNLPSPAALDAVSQQTCADVWAIWNHLSAAKRAGTLFAPKEREFTLDPALSLATEGGATGWQIPIRVQLDGYRP